MRGRAFRDKVRGEQNLVIIFGDRNPRRRRKGLGASSGGQLPGAKFICLGDYANSRGAADMGLYPDLLPGYAPCRRPDAARAGVGRFRSRRRRAEPFADGAGRTARATEGAVRSRVKSCGAATALIRSHYPRLCGRAGHVPDRDRAIADVVLPAANAYEKSGTFTNTCGDLQLMKKAARRGRRHERFRDDRAYRRPHGLRRAQAGAVRRRRSAPTWENRAARNRVKLTVTRFGWKRTDLEPR